MSGTLNRAVYLALAASAAVGSAFLGMAAFSSAPAPTVGFAPDVADLGELDWGVHPCQAEFYNAGSQALVIHNIRKSCDCTNLEIGDRTVPAGGKIPVTIQWNTDGQKGEVARTVVVCYAPRDAQGGSRSAGAGEAALTLTARIVPDYDVQPTMVFFSRGQRDVQKVLFAPRRDADARIVGVRSPHRAITAAVSDDGKGLQVSFDPEQWHDEGSLLSLTVETNNKRSPTLEIPIRFRG